MVVTRVPIVGAGRYRQRMSGAVATSPMRTVGVASRPKFRGYLHTWTAVLAIPASVLLILAARPATARVGASIYAASVLALFGTSAAYHLSLIHI